MLDIGILKPEEKNEYIDFLVRNFAEYSDPQALRDAASKEIDCMFSDYFRKPVFYTFRLNGELVGTSGIIREWIAPNTNSIFWVCVKNDYRGHGYGTHIMTTTAKAFADEVQKGQAGTLILYCLNHNCAFYETLGYERGPKGHKWTFMSLPVNV